MIQSLDVMLWGDKVGTLIATRERYNEKICFYFDDEFLKKGLDVAPLRASINRTSLLPVYGESDRMFGGLPSFIADSLPDSWGDRVFSKWAQASKISLRHLSVLDRLAYIGIRGMGAFEFVPPAAKEMEKPVRVEIPNLHKLAQSALSDAKAFKTDLTHDIMIESLFKVGTSAGGRRPKAILNINFDTGECYSGQVPAPMAGFTPVIIKFDEKGDTPTTQIEYAYWLMAQQAGLDMMPSRLLESGDAIHFVTERFDRYGSKKVYVQTLAAMEPASTSYEDLFEVAAKIEIAPKEMSHLFRWMTMNVICGNVDDHNKNFSFMMGREGIWHVTPAYDFTFTVDPSAPGYVNRHSMTIAGKNYDITRDDLLQIAKAFDIKQPNSIIDAAIDSANCFTTHAAKAGISAEWTAKIQDEISTRISQFKRS